MNSNQEDFNWNLEDLLNFVPQELASETLEIDADDFFADFEYIESINGSPLLDISDSVSTYMYKFTNILSSRNKEITLEKTLELNKNMQECLKEFRINIENLIKKCQDLHEHNFNTLKFKMKPYSYKSKAHYCGVPFFKCDSFRLSQNQHDYIHRKYDLKEFFPIDLHLMKCNNWSASDKLALQKHLTLQMLNFKNIPENSVCLDSSDEQQMQVIFNLIFDF